MSDQPQPTPEEVNRAIAESLGWTDIRPGKLYTFELYGDSPDKKEIGRTKLPNFWSSLDACAEMERHLSTAEELDSYVRHLCVIHDRRFPFEAQMLCQWAAVVCADSESRCQAYLRLKGLWRWG